MGKTALVAEVGHELEPAFDRVVPVELVDATHEGDVLRLVAMALVDDAAADIERVASALDTGSILVLLDNCEHVIDEVAAVLVDLFARTVEARVLATSRRLVEVGAEVIWTVEPLQSPVRSESDTDLIATPAAQLFLERVRQAVPTFEITDLNRATVAALCAAAEGVPLVLELAAALTRSQPLDDILRAMTERPACLTTTQSDRPEHQRSRGVP